MQTGEALSGYVCPSDFAYNDSRFVNASDCTLPTGVLVEVLVTSAAEIPGYFVTLLLIDKIGRKYTLALELLLAAGCLFGLYLCLPGAVSTIAVFILRATNAGCIQTIILYTSELYPTSTRTLGLGMCMAISRLGGIAASYVMSVMVGQSKLTYNVALGVAGALPLLAIAAVMMLPFETMGRRLREGLPEEEKNFELEGVPKYSVDEHVM